MSYVMGYGPKMQALETVEVKGPISTLLQMLIYSTWPNPPRPMVWHWCAGCEAERLWYDCDVVAHEHCPSARYCRNCEPVNTPYQPHPWYRPGCWEGC